MHIKPIRTDDDHAAAMRLIESLWDAEPDTPEHDHLEVLGQLVADYEDGRWPIGLPDPVEAIKFRMEQAGYTQADLAALLRSRSRASELLNRTRALSIDQIRKLHEAWRIPLESLIKPYGLRAA